MRPLRRRGMGILLLLGCAALVAVTILATTRLTGSSTAVRVAAASAGGAVAEQAALSLLEEALWRFQRGANDPTADLFNLLRDRKGASSDLATLIQPRTYLDDAAKLEGGSLRTLALERFEASFVEGSLSLACTVTVRLDRRLVRRSAQGTWRCGVTTVTEPPPYGQLTLAVVQCGPLEVQLPTVAWWLDRIEEHAALVRRYNAFAEFLEQFPLTGDEPVPYELTPFFPSFGAAPTEDQNEAAALGELYGREPWRQREWEMETNEGRERNEPFRWRQRRVLDATPQGQLRLLIPGRASFGPQPRAAEVFANTLLRETVAPASVLVGLEPTLSLPDYDVNARLADTVWPLADRAVALGEEMKDRSARALLEERKREASSNLPSEVEAVRSLARELFDLVVQQGRNFEASLDEFNRVTAFELGHCLAGFPPPPFGDGKPLGYHVEQATPEADLAEVTRRWGGLNAHVFVAPMPCSKPHPPDEAPFGLTLPSWRGAGVVTAFRPARLGPVGTRGGGGDLCVLSLQKVELAAGRIDAGLCCAAADFLQAPTIAGNLVLASQPFVRHPKPKEQLRGTVTYDPRLFAGFGPLPDPDMLDDAARAGLERRLKDNDFVAVVPRGWSRTVRAGR